MAAGLLTSILVISFVVIIFDKHRLSSTVSPCAINLKIIYLAKERWRNEFHKVDREEPSWEDLSNGLMAYKSNYNWTNGIPVCPQGGNYIIGHLSEIPRCTIGGGSHSLPLHGAYLDDKMSP